MTNSEYEYGEMEYLIESGTEPEGNEEPDSNEEDQEEDPEANDIRGNKSEEYPASEWARWIEKAENRQNILSNTRGQKDKET